MVQRLRNASSVSEEIQRLEGRFFLCFNMDKLWQKDWELDKFIETFETKEDLLLDEKLVKFDVLGTIAHAMTLAKSGLLTEAELTDAKKGLSEVLLLVEKGKFTLQIGDEDIHTKIENFLTEKYGEVGKKIHTGRSRNDQVLGDIRLFTKEQLLFIWQETLALIDSLLLFAEKYEFTPIPGYTHMQKAMPASLGMWAGSFAEALMDDLVVLKAAYKLNNQSPLGSAAGFGVPLDLDREYTAKLLGFNKVQANSLYCQNSRGKIESVILSSLIPILMDINKFASDVLLFTTTEFNFFDVAEELCTGSSIMPQKKNVDIAELLRSKIHLVLGYYVQLVSLSSNLISGYNRDLQDSKKPLFEGLEITKDSLAVANILIKNIKPNKEALEKAMTPEIFATHKALKMVRQGTPFREAYQQISSDIQNFGAKDIVQVLKESTHVGGTGNMELDNIASLVTKEKDKFKTANNKYHSAISKLISTPEGGEVYAE